MKIKHQELEIPSDNPFLNCQLDREKYAHVLSEIIRSYADGFVLAINNEWGGGKTTFVKMWRAMLEKSEFKTVYFNAWENDFDGKPLVALISELKTLLESETNTKAKKSFNDVLKTSATFIEKVIPAVAKAFVKRHGGDELAQDIFEGATTAATEILNDEIKEYTNKKQGIVEFKKSLEKFVGELDNNKPIIIFIDELDRCRPDYAVEVLENMKHFFSVSGIVFVLSIDKKQMCHSIEGYYGSSAFDSNSYLKRFIDLEYQIPKPDLAQSCNYFYNYFGFDEFFQSKARTSIMGPHVEKQDFKSFTVILFSHYELQLREQERILGSARLILKQFHFHRPAFAEVLILLILFKNFNSKFYREISEKSLGLNNFYERIAKELPLNLEKKMSPIWYLYFIARLIKLFHNSSEEMKQKPLYRPDQVLFNYVGNPVQFIEALQSMENDGTNGYTVDYLISRIDLTEDFQS